MHAGVGAAQFTSLAHDSHNPAFAWPGGTHAPAMHSRVVVQVPSPSWIPQTFPFVSQTAVRQARAPEVSEQGIGSVPPLAIFGSQVPGPGMLLHHSVAPHSASVKQAVPQAPLVALQNGPLCVPVMQLVSFAHLPHVPATSLQYGFAEVGQGLLALDPLSPLQGTQVPLAVLHTGSAAVAQFAALVHWTQDPALPPVSTHTGLVAVGQGSPVAVPKLPVQAAHLSLCRLRCCWRCKCRRCPWSYRRSHR